MNLRMLADLTTDMVRELAVAEKVCVRPLLRRVLDRESGTEEIVPIACGSTMESVCPSCAHKARILRMQQCAEGWHLGTEPDSGPDDDHDHGDDRTDQDQDAGDHEDGGDRRVRSTKRRRDVVDLPRLPADDRTIGRTFTSPDGREYRDVPDPDPALVPTVCRPGPISTTIGGRRWTPCRSRSWWTGSGRTCAAAPATRCTTSPPSNPNNAWPSSACRDPGRYPAPAAPPGHPRHLRAGVVAPLDRAVYVHRTPVWDGTGYIDQDTGQVLPTWEGAVDALVQDPDAKPAHVMRFGTQADIRGIIAPSEEADRAIRYLTKYLTKAIAEPLTGSDADEGDERREAHIDRLHDQVRWLPCSEHCTNWLRYGIQPKNPTPGMQAGHCPSKAHDREHLGVGGRRVLVSRHWSGKTLSEHKADRATVVREALHAAGIVPPEIERLFAEVKAPDGLPRYVWTDSWPGNAGEYRRMIFKSIQERRAWREQYQAVKITLAEAVDNPSAIDHDGPDEGPAP